MTSPEPEGAPKPETLAEKVVQSYEASGVCFGAGSGPSRALLVSLIAAALRASETAREEAILRWSSAAKEVESLRYTSDKQTVAWKERALKSEAKKAVDVLREVVDWQGVDHEEDCSGDDTCACPLVAKVNAALRPSSPTPPTSPKCTGRSPNLIEQSDVCDDTACLRHGVPTLPPTEEPPCAHQPYCIEGVLAPVPSPELPRERYNPLFGDDKLCACTHEYSRHFDTYDSMYPVGCKYCECRTYSLPADPTPEPPREADEWICHAGNLHPRSEVCYPPCKLATK